MSDRTLVLNAGSIVDAVVIGTPDIVLYPAGYALVPFTDALAAKGVGIGWRRVAGEFVDPNAPAAPTPADLLAYANAQRKGITEGVNGNLGRVIPVTIASGTYPFPIDATTRAAIGDAVTQTTLPGGDGAVIKSWLLPNATFVTLDSTAVVTVALEISKQFQLVFDAQAKAFAGIKAGTVTTTAQVDAIFAGG